MAAGSECVPVTKRPCDVCRLVDGVRDLKVVTYCKFCDAYMCEPCFNNMPKRAKAWALRAMRRGLGLDKEVADEQ